VSKSGLAAVERVFSQNLQKKPARQSFLLPYAGFYTRAVLLFAMGQTVEKAVYQNGDAGREIIKIEREWVESRSNGDAPFTENLLAGHHLGFEPFRISTRPDNLSRSYHVALTF
jgi:hypothetical protein